MIRPNVSKFRAGKAVSVISKRFSSTTSEGLNKTPFYDLHLELKGTMVDFAGYSMPVLYKGQSHIESHNWTRSKAGLFDVSHMLQHRFAGPGTTEFLEKITPADLKSLKPFSSTLSVLLTTEGGIVDDTIICKHGDEEYYVVTNAGCREKDLKFIHSELDQFGKGNISRESIEGGLLALQGPEAAAALQKLTTDDLSKIKFGESAFISLLGGKYHAARGGYTGEDGFEISIPDEKVALEFARTLLDNPESVQPIGLAARDSLRLEAGMCLYGHELNEEITPVEAGLTWVVGKSRRTPEGATFNGAANILAQIADKNLVKQSRKGIAVKGPAARENMAVFSADGTTLIGRVTSGSYSPTTKQNIGMAYVPKELKIGSDVKVEIRGKLRDGKIAKMPFITPNYYRG